MCYSWWQNGRQCLSLVLYDKDEKRRMNGVWRIQGKIRNGEMERGVTVWMKVKLGWNILMSWSQCVTYCRTTVEWWCQWDVHSFWCQLTVQGQVGHWLLCVSARVSGSLEGFNALSGSLICLPACNRWQSGAFTQLAFPGSRYCDQDNQLLWQTVVRWYLHDIPKSHATPRNWWAGEYLMSHPH